MKNIAPKSKAIGIICKTTHGGNIIVISQRGNKQEIIEAKRLLAPLLGGDEPVRWEKVAPLYLFALKQYTFKLINS